MADRVAELQEQTRRLAALLAEPQPGFFTWWEAVGRAVDAFKPEPAPASEAFIESNPKSPYAFIQWKGTDVCMDWYCECGEQAHVDSDFAYHVECPHCHRRYEVGCFMPLRPTTATPDVKPFAPSQADHDA